MKVYKGDTDRTTSGVKKTKYLPGETMKKFLLVVIAIVMTLAMLFMTLSGCKNNIQKVGVEDFNVIDMDIGKTMPKTSCSVALQKDMSAYEMFETALNNYYNADFVISQQYGTALTSMGVIKKSQVVDVVKIRDGKGDASGNNLNGATYFADSISYSSVTSLYEKMVIRPDQIAYRNANTSYVSKENTVNVKSWNDIQTNFSDFKDFTEQKHNNPTLLWMYDTREDYVEESSKPVYDAATDTYRFALIFDPIESTKDYIDTMKVQLGENAGMTVKGLDFLQLRLRVVLWSNGMIRNIHITESYDMKLAKGILSINGNVTLKTEVQFSYDRAEAGYELANNIQSFYDTSAVYLKPYGSKSVDKLLSIQTY